MKSLCILGRQPKLGMAELESLYGPNVLVGIAPQVVSLELDTDQIDFTRLGGSIKLAKILASLPGSSWSSVEKYLTETITAHLKPIPDGKLTLGLSVYGIKVSPRDLQATGLRLKKIIKATDRPVRIVPNKSPALNSAQVLHNQLTGPHGCELLVIRHGNNMLLAQTVAEQDIEAYARRDQNRPMRDAKVGMLPPKLAQLLINLANPAPGSRLLDPFCGTGVVLQEALLMGYAVYGTDIDARMVSYAKDNLAWLQNTYLRHGSAVLMESTLEVADATTHKWQPPVEAIAAETFLGKPLTSIPPLHILEQIRKECDLLHERFLKQLASQLPSGTRLCLGVPAWRTRNGFLHLKTLDHLEGLGYNRISFVHAGAADLIYHREDQAVARELIVLAKK